MRCFIGELPRSQIFFKLDCRNRLTVEKALRFLAAFAKQELRLRFGLDAFGDDLKAEIVGHDDQRTHDRGGIGVVNDLAHKATIDLDSVRAESGSDN